MSIDLILGIRTLLITTSLDDDVVVDKLPKVIPVLSSDTTPPYQTSLQLFHIRLLFDTLIEHNFQTI